MNILFIAPIPPPINGQSKASKVLLDAIDREHNVDIININKSSLKSGLHSVKRVVDILRILTQINNKKKNKDIIYLSLAESFAGNMRDIAIYYLCRRRLNRMYIHMLGGAGMKKILEANNWQMRLNKRFLKKIAGVFVEGEINYQMFKKVMPEENIHIVPNFAEDFLFASDNEIIEKFKVVDPIKIVYLSNLIPGKGYLELVDAYLNLSPAEQNSIQISFVGGFENEESKLSFETKIDKVAGLKYLGHFIDGEEKRNLYCSSHIFCLPTYYPFEGQPISILEAYATGCAVITSDHSGIPFIFKDDINGFMVKKKSVQSLTSALKKAIGLKSKLLAIGLHNKNEAQEKYRTSIYQTTITTIIEKN